MTFRKAQQPGYSWAIPSFCSQAEKFRSDVYFQLQNKSMVLPKPLLLVSLHVLYLRTSTYCNTARQAAMYLRHQVLPAPRRLTLKRPHLTFSSGAELSHCEQRGKQSLFTNQLSSAPRQRGLRLSTTIFQMRFFRDASAPFLFGLYFFCLTDGEDATGYTYQIVTEIFRVAAAVMAMW